MYPLFAALLLIAQPAPDAEASQAEEFTPVESTPQPVEEGTEPVTEPTDATVADQTAVAEEAAAEPQPVDEEVADRGEAKDEEDELICRRKMVQSNRFGERNRMTKVCKTRLEWLESRTKRPRR